MNIDKLTATELIGNVELEACFPREMVSALKEHGGTIWAEALPTGGTVYLCRLKRNGLADRGAIAVYTGLQHGSGAMGGALASIGGTQCRWGDWAGKEGTDGALLEIHKIGRLYDVYNERGEKIS